MFGSREKFGYAECATCGTLFIEEIPEDLSPYYETESYYSFEDPVTRMGRPGVAQAVALVGRGALFGPQRLVSAAAARVPVREVRTLVSILEAVRLSGLSKGKDSRVLDVGAGSGTLVYALGRAGLRHVIGIDPFAGGDRSLPGGGQLLRRDLSEMTGEFDLVMLHHSLEHVPEPRETLTLASGLLAPGGRILVRMPTVSSEAFETYGSAWIGCDAPRHLTVFSREGMATLCRELGLRLEHVVDDSNESQFWASEQYVAGVPLTSENSHFVNPKRSMFSRHQIRSWQHRAAALNRTSRGDQAAWILAPGG
jgi:SAM-dependent methyltransferase